MPRVSHCPIPRLTRARARAGQRENPTEARLLLRFQPVNKRRALESSRWSVTMLLQEILNQVPGTELKGNPLVRILGISYDSRKVRDGHLFVAIKGEKTDGTQFVGEALRRGARAVCL